LILIGKEIQTKTCYQDSAKTLAEGLIYLALEGSEMCVLIHTQMTFLSSDIDITFLE